MVQSCINSEMKRDIGRKFTVFIPPCIRRSRQGGPRLSIAITFGIEKLEWCGYPRWDKFDDKFSCVDTVPACDEQTDRQTDRHLATA